MDKAALEQLVQRDPRCTLAPIVAYAQWVQRNERAMGRLVQRDIRPQLAASLSELACRLGEPTDGGVVIEVHLIHQTLADRLCHRALASPRRWPVFGARVSSSPG